MVKVECSACGGPAELDQVKSVAGILPPTFGFNCEYCGTGNILFSKPQTTPAPVGPSRTSANVETKQAPVKKMSAIQAIEAQMATATGSRFDKLEKARRALRQLEQASKRY